MWLISLQQDVTQARRRGCLLKLDEPPTLLGSTLPPPPLQSPIGCTLHSTGQQWDRWEASQERARNPEGSPETKKKTSPGQAEAAAGGIGWMRSSQRCTNSPVRREKPLRRRTGGFKSFCPIRHRNTYFSGAIVLVNSVWLPNAISWTFHSWAVNWHLKKTGNRGWKPDNIGICPGLKRNICELPKRLRRLRQCLAGWPRKIRLRFVLNPYSLLLNSYTLIYTLTYPSNNLIYPSEMVTIKAGPNCFQTCSPLMHIIRWNLNLH